MNEFTDLFRSLHRAQRITAVFVLLSLIGVIGVAFGLYDRGRVSDSRYQETRAAVDGLSVALDEANRRLENAGRPPVTPPATVEGPSGPAGLQGPRGIQGPPGPQGPPGVDGKDGAAGVRGVPGATITGPAGDDGADGVDGADSTVPGPAGPQGERGPSPTDQQVRGAVDDFCGQGRCVGPQGPPGADSTVPGPAGPAGPAGQSAFPFEWSFTFTVNPAQTVTIHCLASAPGITACEQVG